MTPLRYPDAYRLMLYRSKTTGTEEWLWNSRDGVTPFGITASDGSEAFHVDFYRDVFAPFHVPPVGSRVFVDLTEQRARHFADRRIEAMLNNPEHAKRIQEEHASREELFDLLVKDMLSRAGAPDVLVVSKEMQEHFRARGPVPHPLAGTRFA